MPVILTNNVKRFPNIIERQIKYITTKITTTNCMFHSTSFYFIFANIDLLNC